MTASGGEVCRLSIVGGAEVWYICSFEYLYFKTNVSFSYPRFEKDMVFVYYFCLFIRVT